MKHLFFVAVAGGIFSGTTISVKAQALVSIERVIDKSQPKISLKFIEGIELKPAVSVTGLPAEAEDISSKQLAATGGSVTGNGFFRNIEACSALQFKYAMLTERDVESLANFSLYSFIDSWWGTRYRYGGTDRDGIDCSAFTGKLLSAVYGLALPRTAKDQYDLCNKIETADLTEGDLVFFNTRGGISHVGLYLGNNYFVHSSVHGGVTINSLTDDYYSKRFISGGRLIIK
jgi:lipoprotein Spr